jgi:hypothetical protein
LQLIAARVASSNASRPSTLVRNTRSNSAADCRVSSWSASTPAPCTSPAIGPRSRTPARAAWTASVVRDVERLILCDPPAASTAAERLADFLRSGRAVEPGASEVRPEQQEAATQLLGESTTHALVTPRPPPETTTTDSGSKRSAALGASSSRAGCASSTQRPPRVSPTFAFGAAHAQLLARGRMASSWRRELAASRSSARTRLRPLRGAACLGQAGHTREPGAFRAREPEISARVLHGHERATAALKAAATA